LIPSAITAGASLVASGLLCLHAVANIPAGSMELVRSSVSIASGLPPKNVRSAPATTFSGPAQRSLTLRPARSLSRQATLLHRGLRQLCCLRCRLDCFRVERTSSRAGVSPAEVQRFSRCTPSPVIGRPKRGHRVPDRLRCGPQLRANANRLWRRSRQESRPRRRATRRVA
jgi:hypothetical protein